MDGPVAWPPAAPLTRPARLPLARIAIWSVPVLLGAALILLIVGLIGSTSAWLAASLACSVVAAVVLLLERFVLTPRTARAASPAPTPVEAASARADTPAPAPVEAPAPARADTPAPVEAPGPVQSASAPVHSPPLEDRADSDGPTDRADSAEPDDAEGAEPDDDEGFLIDPDDPNAVWVADGYPRFHVRGCPALVGLDTEPIPRDEAVEDGFVACPQCEPVAGAAPTSTPA